MVSDAELKSFVRLARNDHYMSLQAIEKHAFEALLSGMIIKLMDKKGEVAEKQLAQLKRMESYMERQTNMNCIFHFQAKSLVAQDRRIAILEQEKMDLMGQLTEIKKRISL